MPISSVVNHLRRRLDTVITGSVRLSEVRRHIDWILADGLEGYRELIDVRGAAAPYWSPSEIWKVPGLLGKPNEHHYGWRAIVADTKAQFALARLFATIASRYVPVAVFDDLERAQTWLARSDDPIMLGVSREAPEARPSRRAARR
ncbi:MAG: hypothetical protein DMF90_07205 [Acidobacteria bacterium]|nr:MAG: hypothetical protein DMF90_07205 [Acidobacteriota bacterium]